MASGATDRNFALNKFDETKRVVAKMLARENITVQWLDGQPTASFDTVQRVLTLPNWPFANVDQLDTQIGHEVGHALFTDNTYLENLAKRRKNKPTENFFGFFNVVEDARIERKMREAYPGMKAVFYNGRKAFTEKGPIFQIADSKHVVVDKKKCAVAKMRLIDRINTFYKIGAFIDVPFAPEERQWIQRIDACYSTENAVEIAAELYELAKEEEKEEQRQQQEQAKQKQQGGKPEKSSGESGDGEPSKEKSSQKGKAKGGKKGDDKKSDSQDETDGKSADHEKDGQGDDSESGDDNEAEESNGDRGGDDNEGASDADGESDEDDSSDGGSGRSNADSGDEGDDDTDVESGDADNTAKSASNAPASNESPDSGSTEPEPDPEAVTDKAIAQALQKLVEQALKDPSQQIRHLLIAPVPEAEVKRRTVTAAEWIDKCERWLKNANAVNAETLESTLRSVEQRWNEKYLLTAKHMAQEFQRRKSAKNLQHARTGKTGKLDMNRLHSFKYANDLFKRVMVVPNGQSHGIVMIIDGSSSMSGVFGNVVDQVLLFANFAFMCNIPFEAYMFTDRQAGGEKSLTTEHRGLQTITLPASGRLVGLVNTATDRASFKRQVRMVTVLRSQYGEINSQLQVHGLPYSQLGGTPLYVGMMLMERHMERMKRTLKLDKMIGVVVSDGGDTAHLYYGTNTVDPYSGSVRQSFDMLGNQAFVARDTVTKKNHSFVAKATYHNAQYYTAENNAILTLLLNVMKDRHDARNIYLFLIDSYTNAHDAAQTIVRAGETVTPNDPTITKAMSTDEQYTLKNGAADCAIVMKTAALQLKENDFAKTNTKGMTTEKIGEKFVAAQKKAIANRVFVNTVMPFLA